MIFSSVRLSYGLCGGFRKKSSCPSVLGKLIASVPNLLPKQRRTFFSEVLMAGFYILAGVVDFSAS